MYAITLAHTCSISLLKSHHEQIPGAGTFVACPSMLSRVPLKNCTPSTAPRKMKSARKTVDERMGGTQDTRALIIKRNRLARRTSRRVRKTFHNFAFMFTSLLRHACAHGHTHTASETAARVGRHAYNDADKEHACNDADIEHSYINADT